MKPQKKEIQFCVLFSIIFAFLTTYFIIKGESFYTVFFSILLIILWSTFFLLPKLFTKIYRIWMQLGFALHVLMSNLILVFIFYLIFFPISLLFKIFKRDRLKIKFRSRNSNWIYPYKDFKEDFRRQF